MDNPQNLRAIYMLTGEDNNYRLAMVMGKVIQLSPLLIVRPVKTTILNQTELEELVKVASPVKSF